MIYKTGIYKTKMPQIDLIPKTWFDHNFSTVTACGTAHLDLQGELWNKW